MVDIKKIRSNPDLFKEMLKRRIYDVSLIDKILDLYSEKNKIKIDIDNLRNKKKELSSQFLEKNNESSRKESLYIDERIFDLDTKYKDILEEYNNLSLMIPNILSSDTPDEIKVIYESDNEKKIYSRDYIECVGIDVENAVKLSGSQFVGLNGKLARIERKLSNKMIEINSDYYTEYSMPYIVNVEIVRGTGQWPKFEKDLYRTSDGQYLIPTGEVSLVGMIFNKNFSDKDLPMRMTTVSPCFRKESGGISDGLIRTHQFHKVELVHVCKMENAKEEFSLLVNNVRKVLDYFKLHYRIIALPSNDLGFTAEKTYDFEVWMPSRNKYVEISSVSNCGDFQSRRLNSKDSNGEYLATLNGSGVAVGRCLTFLLEYYGIEKIEDIVS